MSLLLLSTSRSSAPSQGGGSSEWQLDEGHYVDAKQSMMLIYPRPDAETSSNARHRWAYYDGSNAIQFRIPIGIAFGAPPFHFEVIAGPSGMTVGQVYGDANYGIVTWTPSGAESGTTCTVRVTDQELNTVDVTWTVSTSSSTDHFIFVDGANGDDDGTGAIDDPFETASEAFGSTFETTANPGAICYFRTGTYDLPSYGGASMELHSSRKPMALIAFPGESVTIDGTTSRIWAGASADDIFLQDFALDGYRSDESNYRAFGVYSADRFTADGIHWTNAGYGTSGSSNATMFYGPSGPTREYLYVHDCSESGREGSGSDNSYGICSLYSQTKGLFEGCHFEGDSNRYYYLKGTNEDMCMRYCTADATGGSFGEGFSPSGDSNRIEWCYNSFKASNGRMTNTLESTLTNLWVYRNSFYDVHIEFDDPNSAGPYVVENNAIMSDDAAIVETGSEVTVSGTECHGDMNSGILDSETLALLGSFRTSYLGTRGAEIA